MCYPLIRWSGLGTVTKPSWEWTVMFGQPFECWNFPCKHVPLLNLVSWMLTQEQQGDGHQGYHMVYFQTKNPIWVNFGGPLSGKYGYNLWPYGHMAIVMYVHRYVFMYVHRYGYVFMYVHRYVFMYVHRYVFMYVHRYVCMHVQTVRL
jgi:hypothetical protein